MNMMMKCAVAVRPAGQWDSRAAIDKVTLDSSERHCRRVVLTGEHGLAFLLDLPHTTMLSDGDGLVLDDGAIIRVAGKPEPLVEIAAKTARDLARLSWHIGNRHIDIQILRDRLRMRRDHVLEQMISSLGASITPIEAIFDPEPGVYTHTRHQDHGQ
jgi:urease accessory protein